MVPVTLLTVFTGILWLLGLVVGDKRREYVTEISNQAMRAASAMMGAALAENPQSLPDGNERPSSRTSAAGRRGTRA
jgi:hypothetical protein